MVAQELREQKIKQLLFEIEKERAKLTYNLYNFCIKQKTK